jgi:hypothetical protein
MCCRLHVRCDQQISTVELIAQKVRVEVQSTTITPKQVSNFTRTTVPPVRVGHVLACVPGIKVATVKVMMSRRRLILLPLGLMKNLL